MSHFIKSEVARLVLSYLNEFNLGNTSHAFIEECPYIQEIKELEPEEVKGFLLVHGRSLTDILREYVGIGNEIRRIAREVSPETYDSIRFEPPVKILKTVVASLQEKASSVAANVCSLENTSLTAVVSASPAAISAAASIPPAASSTGTSASSLNEARSSADSWTAAKIAAITASYRPLRKRPGFELNFDEKLNPRITITPHEPIPPPVQPPTILWATSAPLLATNLQQTVTAAAEPAVTTAAGPAVAAAVGSAVNAAGGRSKSSTRRSKDQTDDDFLAELFGIGESIASLANETVAQGEISKVVERGLDNPQLFQDLVHFYDEKLPELDVTMDSNVSTPQPSPAPSVHPREEDAPNAARQLPPSTTPPPPTPLSQERTYQEENSKEKEDDRSDSHNKGQKVSGMRVSAAFANASQESCANSSSGSQGSDAVDNCSSSSATKGTSSSAPAAPPSVVGGRKGGGRKGRQPRSRAQLQQEQTAAAGGLFNRFLQISQASAATAGTIPSSQAKAAPKVSPELSRFATGLQSIISRQVANLDNITTNTTTNNNSNKQQRKGSATGGVRRSKQAASAKKAEGRGKKGAETTNEEYLVVIMSEEEEEEEKGNRDANSSQAKRPSAADPDAAVVTDQTVAKDLLLRGMAKKRRRKPEALLQPKKCGKCVGCRRPVCGYCPVCLDNPKFGGRWEKFNKRGCRGKVCINPQEEVLANLSLDTQEVEIYSPSKHVIIGVGEETMQEFTASTPVSSESVSTRCSSPHVRNLLFSPPKPSSSASIAPRTAQSQAPAAASPIQTFHPSWNSSVNTIVYDDYKTEDEKEDMDTSPSGKEVSAAESQAVSETAAVTAGESANWPADPSSEEVNERTSGVITSEKDGGKSAAETSSGDATDATAETAIRTAGESGATAVDSSSHKALAGACGAVVIPTRQKIYMPFHPGVVSSPATSSQPKVSKAGSNADGEALGVSKPAWDAAIRRNLGASEIDCSHITKHCRDPSKRRSPWKKRRKRQGSESDEPNSPPELDADDFSLDTQQAIIDNFGSQLLEQLENFGDALSPALHRGEEENDRNASNTTATATASTAAVGPKAATIAAAVTSCMPIISTTPRKSTPSRPCPTKVVRKSAVVEAAVKEQAATSAAFIDKGTGSEEEEEEGRSGTKRQESCVDQPALDLSTAKKPSSPNRSARSEAIKALGATDVPVSPPSPIPSVYQATIPEPQFEFKTPHKRHLPTSAISHLTSPSLYSRRAPTLLTPSRTARTTPCKSPAVLQSPVSERQRRPSSLETPVLGSPISGTVAAPSLPAGQPGTPNGGGKRGGAAAAAAAYYTPSPTLRHEYCSPRGPEQQTTPGLRFLQEEGERLSSQSEDSRSPAKLPPRKGTGRRNINFTNALQSLKPCREEEGNELTPRRLGSMLEAAMTTYSYSATTQPGPEGRDHHQSSARSFAESPQDLSRKQQLGRLTFSSTSPNRTSYLSPTVMSTSALTGFQRSPANTHTDSESDALVIANSESEIERDESNQQQPQQQRRKHKDEEESETVKKLPHPPDNPVKSSVMAGMGKQGSAVTAAAAIAVTVKDATRTKPMAGKRAVGGKADNGSVSAVSSNLSDSETTGFPAEAAVTHTAVSIRPSQEQAESIDLGLSSETDSESMDEENSRLTGSSVTSSTSSSDEDSDLEGLGATGTEGASNNSNNSVAQLSFAASFIEVKRRELAEGPKGSPGLPVAAAVPDKPARRVALITTARSSPIKNDASSFEALNDANNLEKFVLRKNPPPPPRRSASSLSSCRKRRLPEVEASSTAIHVHERSVVDRELLLSMSPGKKRRRHSAIQQTSVRTSPRKKQTSQQGHSDNTDSAKMVNGVLDGMASLQNSNGSKRSKAILDENTSSTKVGHKATEKIAVAGSDGQSVENAPPAGALAARPGASVFEETTAVSSQPDKPTAAARKQDEQTVATGNPNKFQEPASKPDKSHAVVSGSSKSSTDSSLSFTSLVASKSDERREAGSMPVTSCKTTGKSDKYASAARKPEKSSLAASESEKSLEAACKSNKSSVAASKSDKSLLAAGKSEKSSLAASKSDKSLQAGCKSDNSSSTASKSVNSLSRAKGSTETVERRSQPPQIQVKIEGLLLTYCKLHEWISP